jgi:hypothetical protein
MERTESIVIQVAPDYENDKIKEMQSFGWNLQSRQEMHVEGDAEGRPSLTGSKYIVTTKVSHYVKLHFARDLNLPNLGEIKKIESEYFNLPFPEIPSLLGPIVLLIIGVLCFSAGKEGLPVALILIAIGGVWFYSRNVQKIGKLLHKVGIEGGT